MCSGFGGGSKVCIQFRPNSKYLTTLRPVPTTAGKVSPTFASSRGLTNPYPDYDLHRKWKQECNAGLGGGFS